MDKLAYKIIVNGITFNDLMISGDTTDAANAMSTCRFTIPNSNGRFNNSSVFTPGSNIEVFGSLDGGTNYDSLFSGVIRNVSFILSTTGRQTMELDCQGGYYLSGMYISPNQVVFRQCDIGHIFVGQKNDMNGESWSADSNGNYPDGLLYLTGYSYLPGSIWSLFPTEVPYSLPRPEAVLDPPDLVEYFTFNAQKLFEVIKYFVDTYGLIFFFNHSDRTIACYRDSHLTDFPTSTYSAKFGTNVNSRNFDKTDDDVFDSVLMIGNSEDIFYIEGDGKYENVYVDDNVKDVDMIVEGAKLRYDIHNDMKISGELVVKPTTESILGKRITIEDGYMDTNANVISVSHRIRETRWDTTIKVDGDSRTIPKLLEEIVETMKKDEKLQDNGQIYLKCFGQTSPSLIPMLGTVTKLSDSKFV